MLNFTKVIPFTLVMHFAYLIMFSCRTEVR